MKISNKYIKDFNSNVKNAGSCQELKSILLAGKKISSLSRKKTHFWQLSQHGIHRSFDNAYSIGVEKFASMRGSEKPPFMEKTSLEAPLPQKIKRMVQKTSLIWGGFGGWLLGNVWACSTSNLILHEQGHAWMAEAIWKGVHVKVSSNAQYWLEHGQWWKWFRGMREGGPGNKTSYSGGTLSSFGASLTPDERRLLVSGAGIGVELALNLLIAGIGLIALRKEKRFLAGGFLSFALMSHLAAFNYIGRYPEYLLKGTDSTSNRGGDPRTIATELAKILGISFTDAFRFLWYGYLFFPMILVGALACLMWKGPEEIPNECVLLRLLAEGEPSVELKKAITEVEIEMAEEIETLDTLEESKKGVALWKICDRLIHKIHKNPLFEKTRTQIKKEIKGPYYWVERISWRLRALALLASFASYELITIGRTVLPEIAKAFHYLVGIFIGFQAIALILDGFQTVKDLKSEQLSKPIKILSTFRLLLSLATCIVISMPLFIPGINAIYIPLLITAASLRAFLALASAFERRRHINKQMEHDQKSLQEHSVIQVKQESIA